MAEAAEELKQFAPSLWRSGISGCVGVCRGVRRVLSACADAGKAATGHVDRAAVSRPDSHGITNMGDDSSASPVLRSLTRPPGFVALIATYLQYSRSICPLAPATVLTRCFSKPNS
jgi:hypothetical protein